MHSSQLGSARPSLLGSQVTGLGRDSLGYRTVYPVYEPLSFPFTVQIQGTNLRQNRTSQDWVLLSKEVMAENGLPITELQLVHATRLTFKDSKCMTVQEPFKLKGGVNKRAR